MGRVLGSLRGALLLGLVLFLAVHVLLAATGQYGWGASADWLRAAARYVHVLSAILWLGLLFYFNLIQVPAMARIPDEQKPAVTGVIAPMALFWFRWGAVVTVVSGLALATFNGYLREALTLGLFDIGSAYTAIGLGMWLGIIMAANVWLIIWPCQRRALGLVEASPDQRKAAAGRALRVSRLNTALAFPMLYCMVIAQNWY